jgi:drug/metabolite transporter (DMT)-like permease
VSPAATAWFQIHFCVVLWGFTAILGRLISLPALPLVWWRMTMVAGALLLLPRVWRALAALPMPLTAALAGTGVLISLHWVTFYGAIKLANASVAATCMALSPVLISLVEPWLVRRPFDRRELILGAGAVPGVALVVGGIPDDMHLGLAVGVLSAVFVAFFSVANKLLVRRADALTVTAVEMGAGVAFLTLLAPFQPGGAPMMIAPGARDAVLLAILASACTLLPYALSLVALRHLTAFGASLAVNLEPVYAILLAMLFFGEQREVTPRFYLGVAVILAGVFVYPLLTRTKASGVSPDVIAPSPQP